MNAATMAHEQINEILSKMYREMGEYHVQKLGGRSVPWDTMAKQHYPVRYASVLDNEQKLDRIIETRDVPRIRAACDMWLQQRKKLIDCVAAKYDELYGPLQRLAQPPVD
jgi:hypothetical protein